MPDLREAEPRRKRFATSNRMMTYTTHSRTFIGESAERVREQLRSLVPGLLHFFSKTEIPEKEVGITDETAEQLPEEINMQIEHLGTARTPLHVPPGIFQAWGKPSSGEAQTPDSSGSDSETA